MDSKRDRDDPSLQEMVMMDLDINKALNGPRMSLDGFK